MLSPKASLRDQPQVENDFSAVEKLLNSAAPQRPKVYSWVPVARFCTVAVVSTACLSALALVGQHLYNNHMTPALPPGLYERAILTVDEKGRITAVAQGAEPIMPPDLPAGTYANATLTVNDEGQITGVASGPALTPGIHSNATVSVDEKGQITSVTAGVLPLQQGASVPARTQQTQVAAGPAVVGDVAPESTGRTPQAAPMPNPALPTPRTDLRPNATADEATIWCKQTYPASIQEWCFDTWVTPRKGSPERAADRLPLPPKDLAPRTEQALTNTEVQKEIDKTSQGGKIVTNYTVFRAVNWNKGKVETGWRFPHNNATTPTEQWCYYRFQHPSTKMTSNLELGSEATPAAIAASGLTSADYREAQRQCVWFNQKKPENA